MIEVITGLVLASAAGLNAYIPLLGLGLLSRFTDLVQLPENWIWLENEWTLGIIGVLLVVEVIVDKVPALDTVNDVLQTVVRPASGGLVFSAGASSDTVAVTDPAAFADSAQFWPFVLGIVVALLPHLLKMIARPLLNLVSAGFGAAVASTLEDIGAVVLTILAVVVPVLALIAVVVTILLLVRRLRRALRVRREQRAAGGSPVSA
ncbi:DUF4126 domain-containing protein [Leucobacter soli]|uniref:DUF4126 domain-containing protein n=1 Tax=Leucobacter soli TaxID=2812850 RepID=A0A916JY88_9MICO|nr:DUF4126 domain-containing protein [Leucobacter soli]CAG7615289.1 hypothetical protein LEUCIP111803_01863 [Leucobacter soli]